MTTELDNLNKRLSNKNFVDKAPKDIVDECKFKLNEGTLQKERITKKLELLNWEWIYFLKIFIICLFFLILELGYFRLFAFIF